MREKFENVAVLIPCYNEEKTIKKVVQDWQKELPEAKIYVYDNNSTDNTCEEAVIAGAVVRKAPLQGKGNVVRRMFREVEANCYILVDGDDTYASGRAKEMVSAVLDDKIDMVVGDRLSSTYKQENKRLFHNFGNVLVKNAINRLFKADVKDIMTGCRAFSHSFVKTFPVLSKGFEVETEMTIHAVVNNLSIRNIVIEYRDRPDGSISKLNTVPDGIKVLKTIFKLFKNYKPLQFFGLLSVMLMLIAASMFIPILITYLQIGLVPRFPTLIVSGFIAIAAILSFFSGLILDAIFENERKNFEFKLQMINQLKNIER